MNYPNIEFKWSIYYGTPLDDMVYGGTEQFFVPDDDLSNVEKIKTMARELIINKYAKVNHIDRIVLYGFVEKKFHNDWEFMLFS